MDLQQLKTLFSKGLDYANQNSSWWFPPNKEASDYQLQLANNAPDLTSFMSAVGIFNHTFINSFPGPQEVCKFCTIQQTPILFGNGTSGWYFLVGNFESFAYCITIIRVEIASPHVIKQEKINPSDAVAWCVCGGYGPVGGPWINIPYTFIQMKYTNPSYSTFTLEKTTDPINKNSPIKEFSFNSTTPMEFYFHIIFTDDTSSKKTHTITSTLRGRTPPMPNANGTCLSCVGDLGSTYFSYTNPIATAIFNNDKTLNGTGWIDHQTMKTFPPKSFWMNVFITIGLQLSGDKGIGWTWLFIQDDTTDTQYMLSHQIDTRKYNDHFNKGYVMKSDMVCNIYNKGVPNLQSKKCLNNATIEVLDLTTIDTVKYPTSYKVTLPDGKIVVTKAMFGSNPFINSGMQSSYEMPGLLYDETGTKRIPGYGFLEINSMYPPDLYAKRVVQLTHADPSKINIIKSATKITQPFSRKLIAWIAVIIPSLLFLTFIIFIIYITTKIVKPRNKSEK